MLVGVIALKGAASLVITDRVVIIVFKEAVVVLVFKVSGLAYAGRIVFHLDRGAPGEVEGGKREKPGGNYLQNPSVARIGVNVCRVHQNSPFA